MRVRRRRRADPPARWGRHPRRWVGCSVGSWRRCHKRGHRGTATLPTASGRSLVTAAVGMFGGEGEVEESAGDLFAVPRQGGEDVAGWDELPGDGLVVGLPGVEFDPAPPAGLVVAGGAGG